MLARGFIPASLAAALIAAVFAHVGIDVVGDWLVRDDAYDHVAHGSRLIVALVAIAIGTGALVRLFTLLCSAAARSQSARNRLLAATRASLLRIGATVLGATLALVPAMELFDALRAGSTLDDIGDLFGGSLLLGVGMTLGCALAVTLILIATVRWICRHQDRIVAAIASLLRRDANVPFVTGDDSSRETVLFTGVRVAKRRPERGPPARVTAIQS